MSHLNKNVTVCVIGDMSATLIECRIIPISGKSAEKRIFLTKQQINNAEKRNGNVIYA
jgi:hypothetical protein